MRARLVPWPKTAMGTAAHALYAAYPWLRGGLEAAGHPTRRRCRRQWRSVQTIKWSLRRRRCLRACAVRRRPQGHVAAAPS